MEIDFLLKLAQAYQMYDARFIEYELADDMHYASMWVFEELKSKEEYLCYLTEKLTTLRAHNIRMEFEIVQGVMNRYALLVTNQQTPDGPFGFVVDFNDEGKVKMINVTARAFF